MLSGLVANILRDSYYKTVYYAPWEPDSKMIQNSLLSAITRHKSMMFICPSVNMCIILFCL